ncbi:MAG: hypothetical protein AWU55_1563 [Halomonadaceae bacterium T82-2]|nr:MAG: hypothetical protein AWU55_1563 [Halomonadaceae bacterium T82-2]
MSCLDAMLAHAAESLDFLIWHVPMPRGEPVVLAGDPQRLLGLETPAFLAGLHRPAGDDTAESPWQTARRTLLDAASREGHASGRYTLVIAGARHQLEEQIACTPTGWQGLIRRLPEPAVATGPLPKTLEILSRQLLEPMPTSAFIAQRDAVTGHFRYRYSNPAMNEAFESLSIAGRSPREVFGDIAGMRLERYYATSLRDRVPATYEHTLPFQGRYLRLRTTLLTLTHEPDSDDCLIGFVHNLTALAQARRSAANAHRRLRHLLEANPAVLYACAPTAPWAFHYLSRNIQSLLGLPDAHQLHDLGLLARVHPEDRDEVAAWLERVTEADQGRSTLRYRLRHEDGHYLTVQNQALISRPRRTGGERELIGTLLDASREARLLHRLELMTRRIPGLIFQFQRDRDGRTSLPYLAGDAPLLDGLDRRELQHDAQPVLERIALEDRPRLIAAIEKSTRRLSRLSIQLRLHDNGQATHWITLRAQPERSQQGTLWHGVLFDINDQVAKAHRLKKLSDTDALTGLANRRRLMQALASELSRARRHHTTLALILLDLDHFKHINDTWGHLKGDRVLRVLSRLCRDLLRQEDLVARFGGEEIAILLPLTDADAAQRLAERLRHAIAAHDFGLPATRITASLGVAEYRPDDTADTLIERADQRLYAAKHDGRNRVCARA